MRWSVGTKIAVINVVAIALILSVSLTCYWATKKMLDTLQWREHSYEVMDHINLFMAKLVDVETGERGYLLTHQDRFLEPYRAALPIIPEEQAKLKELTADNENQQQSLDNLAQLVASKLGIVERALALTDAKQQQDSLDAGKKLMDQIRTVMSTMRDREQDLFKQRSVASLNSINISFDAILYSTLFAVIFLIVVGYMLARNISQPLQAIVTAAKLLSTSASEILGSVTQLVASGTETAAAVNETTSTIEEVKQTSQITSQKAKSVSKNAQAVDQVSQAGKKSIEQTNADMARIQSQMSSIAESMMRLSEQTQAISAIIESVDDLAQQSNLLAVNASIEAEKAGDQGKGFRVVAQEIKTLAEQSKHATHRVREILSDVQKATNSAVLATEAGNKVVEAGVKKSEEAGDAIAKLVESISAAAQASTQIAASSQQQLIGVEQAATAMENIRQASSQNVGISHQLESSANDLKGLGIRLEELIDKYKI